MTVRRIALIAFLAALLVPAAADAATRYASPTGSGTLCTQPSPCSIGEATAPANVSPGDELVIGTGTYMDAPQIAIQDANVNIHGEAGQPRPVIVSGVSTAMFANVANVSISHLRIEHAGPGATVAGLLMFAGSGTVEDVVIQSDEGTACNLNSGTYTVRNSVCWTAGSGDAGFSTANGPATITLRNVTAIGAGSTNTDGLRATAGSGATTTVNATNVIARTAATDGPSDDVHAAADSTAGSTTTVTLSHSNYSKVFAFAPAPGVATATSPSTNNNQTSLPAFLDAATGLYHQTSTSPTVNAGVTDAQNGTADIDGETRANGTTDIGADEFVATDGDGDGIPDGPDDCPAGNTGWTSNGATDRDIDGCRDAGEDTDDDNDVRADGFDSCPVGDLGWISFSATDRDGDGCRDAGEDLDDDNDTVADGSDSCPAGDMGWTSNASTDNDGDGCRDAGSEDLDDDNDTKADGSDDCPAGDIGWTSNATTDHDSDGCRDAGEDADDDNDAIADGSDSCPVGDLGWTSDASTDNDGDGCRDAGEDLDDDNDTVADGSDNCQPIANADQANNDGDAQGDACDADDDNDTINDAGDNCQFVANADQANNDGDAQGDACDADDDNDGVEDVADNCPTTAGPASNQGCPEGARDTTAPETTISSAPAKRVFKRTARFGLASDDPVARFECSLDGKPFTACASSVQFRVKRGKHVFEARAVDTAGNIDATPASWKWKVKRKRR